MPVDISAPGFVTADYEDVIRAAVLDAMRAPELIAARRRLTEGERVEVVGQLHELRALLYRLLAAVVRADPASQVV